MRLKPRTELIPCYAVSTVFTLLSFFCIWTKNLMYISQLKSNNIISCCKSHSELCPLKIATAETSWKLLYCFYQCFPHYTLCNLYIINYIYKSSTHTYTHTLTHTHTYIYNSTTRHLRYSYILILTNLLWTNLFYYFTVQSHLLCVGEK